MALVSHVTEGGEAMTTLEIMGALATVVILATLVTVAAFIEMIGK